MDTGPIIKEIREKKGIKAVNLYNSILTKQGAIKFENGESDTTVTKFMSILERLNISLEEFEVLYKKNTNRDFYYTNQYIKLFYQKNTEELKSLAIEAKDEYKATTLEKFNHYSALILLLIDYLNNDPSNKDAEQIIRDYLITCEEWGYYEITLFTNALPHLPGEFIDSVYNRVKKRMSISEYMLRHRNEMAIILLNILETKILEKDLTKVKYYMNELMKLKDNTLDNMYIQTMIKYFSTLIVAVFSASFQGETDIKINKIVDFFIFIELNSKAEQCRNFYNTIKETYKDDLNS